MGCKNSYVLTETADKHIARGESIFICLCLSCGFCNQVMTFQQQTPTTETPITASILNYVRNELLNHGKHGKYGNK